MTGAVGRDRRILVVGAGPAGLSAAYYLERAGFERVTVVEREPRVGGKCLSRVVDGRVQELGAILLTPDYRLTLELLEELGLETRHAGAMWAVDPRTGERAPPPTVSAAVSATYLQLLREHREHVGGAGYRAVPPELARPFTEWVEAKGIPELRDVALVPFSTFGYGSLDRLSAAYVLKCVSRRTFLSAAKESSTWPRVVERGYQELMERIAATLRDLRLGVEIRRIERDGGCRMRYRVDGEERDERFDALIVATPLDARGSLAYLDLDEAETELLSRVEYFQYFTTLCRIEGLAPGAILPSVHAGDGFGPPPAGRPCLIGRRYPDSDLVIAYSFSDEGRSTAAEVERGIERYASDVGARLGSILETREWSYFPHVSPRAMAEGFYDRIEERQGERGGYFTGGQLDFDNVEGALRYSRHLVDRYFS